MSFLRVARIGCCAFLMTPVCWAQSGPVAVSPGDAGKLALIESRCPTFSWGGVKGTESYELVVYRLGAEGEEAKADLRETFLGSVDGWTPALDSCLERGGSYAWSVRAVGEQGVSDWSAPALFQVAAGPSQREFEAALTTVQQYLALQEASIAAARESAPAGAEHADEGLRTPSVSSSLTRLIPEAPVTVSLVTEGAIGVGTSTPLADLHVVGGETSAGLLIGTSDTGDGGVAELMLAENEAGDFGVKFRYDGVANKLLLLGENVNQGGEKGPWLEIDRDSGATSFGGQIFGDGTNLTGLTTDAELTTHRDDSTAHHLVPSSLPPAGAAGGDLTGTYPNPTVGPDAVGSAEIVDGSLAVVDLAFDPATQPELDGYLAGVSCPPYQALLGFDSGGAPVCALFPYLAAQSLSTVDSSGDVGWYISIARGADGLPVVSYLDFTDPVSTLLKVAKCNDPACDPMVNGPETVSTVATGDVGATSIAIGSDGLPVISYRAGPSPAYLKVAKCNDPACDPSVNGVETISTVATGDVKATSIALGADGLPVVSYVDLYYQASDSGLNVVKCNDPACDPTVNGVEMVSFVDLIGDSVGWAGSTSITLGADGLPVMSYSSQGSPLKVAKCDNPACDPTVGFGVFVSIVDSGGCCTSITLGADGLPVVSYYDENNGDLKVAKCNDPACNSAVNGAETVSTVDSSEDVGWFPSIALGADGLPVVSYFDETNDDLKVAKCNDPACDPTVNGAETVSTVDSTETVGWYTSIALGADGLPVVSYFDYTNGDLKVAKCNDPACVP